MNQTIVFLILSTFIIIVLPVYLFWPFTLQISTISPTGSPLESELIINRSDDIIYTSPPFTTHQLQLWKGTYSMLVRAKGFEPHRIEVSQPISFSLNPPVNLNLTLSPSKYSLIMFDFRDPTSLLKRYPWLEIQGTTVWGELYFANLSIHELIPAGNYIIRAADPLFNFTFEFNVSLDTQLQQTIHLEPNTNFDRYTINEAEEAISFLHEFARLFHTIPPHFFIHSRSLTFNSGDLLVLACQKEAAKKTKKTPPYYFLPRSHQYKISQGKNCHEAGILGNIILETHPFLGLFSPQDLESILTKNITYFPLAITFNLESGRYVHTRGTQSLSPCHNETTRMGISPTNLVCNAPYLIPWFSPLDGPHTGQLPYPWATGYEGLRHIFSLPIQYGIPVTLFAVNRDLIVFEAFDPSIKQTIQSLAAKGLLEIGSHTWNHRTLGTRPISEEKDDLTTSKAFLEAFSGVPVTGFRAPFNSLLSHNAITHDDITRDIGFSYTSGLADQPMRHNLPVTSFLTSTVLDTSILTGDPKHPFILSGHPYDFTHQELYRNKEIYLRRDPIMRDKSIATILFLIGNGGQPTTMNELAKKRGW